MKIITEKSTALELKEQLTEMKAAPVTGNQFSKVHSVVVLFKP